MRSETVSKFLIDKGYRFSQPRPLDGEHTVANYYKVMCDVRNLPFCVTNDKYTQVCVKECFIHYPQMPEPYHAFTVKIIDEAPQGWIDFKFYGLKEKDVLTKFDEIENALLEVWRVLFSLNVQKESEQQ